MCNEARRNIALGKLREDWGETRIPLRFPEGAPNMAPLESIRITDPTVIIRVAAEAPTEAELITRRWSWPGPSGKPVYNFRSDGRAFRNSATGGRCLIPVDGFYEFTAPADPKAKRKDKWVFTKAGEAWFCIAGLWRGGVRLKDGEPIEAFTMLTTEPGPDIAPYHARQMVVLERGDWAGWIDGSTPAADVCRPAPAGTLGVAPVSS